jgi:hypothetical protein
LISRVGKRRDHQSRCTRKLIAVNLVLGVVIVVVALLR